MWQDWTNAVLGLVVFVAAFMSLTAMSATWTFAILGALIAIVGFWGASQTTSAVRRV